MNRRGNDVEGQPVGVRRQQSRESFVTVADEALMHSVGEGDLAAFETVYDRHSRAAYSLAYRIVGTPATAEEVVQEAFLAVWRGAGRYRAERGSVGTWVLGIVHHRAVDAIRRASVHSRRRASDEGIEERFEAEERTDGEALRRDEAREVRAAVAALPAAQRQVIELAYFGGFTQTEIAGIVEAPLGTVKGRMRLALQKLHATIEEAA